jgi:hypothetical protein
MDSRVERILFALVANRALAPSSTLAATRWIKHDVHIDGLDAVGDEACYRAMDWLIEAEPGLSRIVYDNTANLLNLEVDLLFFDTTSTYFETEDADSPVGRDERGQVVDGDDAGRETGFADLRQVQGLPSGSAADRGRDGPHPRRDPGQMWGLAWEYG